MKKLSLFVFMLVVFCQVQVVHAEEKAGNKGYLFGTAPAVEMAVEKPMKVAKEKKEHEYEIPWKNLNPWTWLQKADDYLTEVLW